MCTRDAVVTPVGDGIARLGLQRDASHASGQTQCLRGPGQAGRYERYTRPLRQIMSEFGLIKYRVVAGVGRTAQEFDYLKCSSRAGEAGAELVNALKPRPRSPRRPKNCRFKLDHMTAARRQV